MSENNETQFRVMPTADHEQDIHTLERFMLKAADERGFCSEFEDWVEAVNEHLNVKLHIDRRGQEVFVRFHVALRSQRFDARTQNDHTRHLLAMFFHRVFAAGLAQEQRDGERFTVYQTRVRFRNTNHMEDSDFE